MIDPIVSAVNLYLGVWNSLPFSFQFLVYLSVALFVIATIVHIIFR